VLVATTYGTNSSQPQLFISGAPNGVLLSWPLGYPTWALEMVTSVVVRRVVAVAAPCGNQASVPASEPKQFFRLHKA